MQLMQYYKKLLETCVFIKIWDIVKGENSNILFLRFDVQESVLVLQ